MKNCLYWILGLFFISTKVFLCESITGYQPDGNCTHLDIDWWNEIEIDVCLTL